jgi:hypothetical protein
MCIALYFGSLFDSDIRFLKAIHQVSFLSITNWFDSARRILGYARIDLEEQPRRSLFVEHDISRLEAGRTAFTIPDL